MPTATTQTDSTVLRVGERELDVEQDAGCKLLAAALASCVHASISAVLQRHDSVPISIRVNCTDSPDEPCAIHLSPILDDTGLQQRLERAILVCPVARQLRIPPRIDWQD